MTEYYKLVKRELKHNRGAITAAAMWHCQLCGSVIASMGGPGSREICVPCGDDIIAGRLRYDRTEGEKP